MTEPSTKLQAKLAALCGVKLGAVSKRSATAMLQVALAQDVLGVVPRLATSDAQKEIAKQLKLRGLSPFKELAALQINAAFVQCNELALSRYKFAPAMCVEFVGGPHVYPLAYAIGAQFVISRVKPDGSVFFKGSNGARAYASQLKPVV